MASQGGIKVGLLPLLAASTVVWGLLTLPGEGSDATAAHCEASPTPCDSSGSPPEPGPEGMAPRPPLQAEVACRNAGYLCADLAATDRIQLRRWRDFSGTVVVHVPRPDYEARDDAIRLQEAAARGLRAWNGQPFEILTDLRGDRDAHFAVQWSATLQGNRLGVARTRWSATSGLEVVSIELSSRSPLDPGRLHTARQVQLTAAHEMGHALGLQHSDAAQDVMYPSNTATRMSARDYRTMEVLYRLEDGTEITR